MIRKISHIIVTYSNGILMILILLSFLSLLSTTSRSRRETAVRILRLDDILARQAPGLADWREARALLGTVHAGRAGRDLERAVAEFDRALERLIDTPVNPAVTEPTEATALRSGGDSDPRRALGGIIRAYTELLQQREAAFDSLFSFLAVGVAIQSFALMVTLGRVGAARAEIRHRDEMIALVQKIREDERRGLASYLHDSVLQDLGGLGLRSALRDDPEGRALLAESIGKLRQVTYGLAPLHLDQAGLAASLRELVAEHLRRGGPPVDFEELGCDEARLDPETRLILYRAVQEGLANVRKHARAGKVELRLVGSHPFLILTLRDDGRGFDPRGPRPSPAGSAGGLGLALLERQVRGLGGEFSLESLPGVGTRLQIRCEPGKENP